MNFPYGHMTSNWGPKTERWDWIILDNTFVPFPKCLENSIYSVQYDSQWSLNTWSMARPNGYTI